MTIQYGVTTNEPDDTKTQHLISRYGLERPRMVEAAARLQSLLRDLIEAAGIKHHTVESRAKEVSSFAEKIGREGKQYDDPLVEMTDLVGLRVITFRLDDVDRACALVNREFLVKETVDNRQGADPDRFGYTSVHKICTLRPERAKLVEWQQYFNIVFEIQVRTVLQHAWAVASHALQYKAAEPLAFSEQRRLARVAGILELADEQFQSIYDSVEQVRLATKVSLEQDGISQKEVAEHESVLRKPTGDSFYHAGFDLGSWVSTAPLLDSAMRQAERAEIGQAASTRESLKRLAELCDILGLQDVKSIQQSIEWAVERDPTLLMRFHHHMRDHFKISALTMNREQIAITMLLKRHEADRRRIQHRLNLKRWNGAFVKAVFSV